MMKRQVDLKTVLWAKDLKKVAVFSVKSTRKELLVFVDSVK